MNTTFDDEEVEEEEEEEEGPEDLGFDDDL